MTLAQQLDAVHDLIMGVDSQLVRHGKVIPPCENNLPQGIPCAAFLTLKVVADLLLRHSIQNEVDIGNMDLLLLQPVQHMIRDDSAAAFLPLQPVEHNGAAVECPEPRKPVRIKCQCLDETGFRLLPDTAFYGFDIFQALRGQPRKIGFADLLNAGKPPPRKQVPVGAYTAPAKSYILPQSGSCKKWCNAGKRFSIDAPRLITILVVGIAHTRVDVLIDALHPSGAALFVPAPVIRM